MWPDGWKAENARAHGRAGLTLFEVLIVMSVLAVLVALVIGLGRHADAAGKRGRAQTDLAVWEDALMRWHLVFDAYPAADGTAMDLLAVSYVSANTAHFRDVAGTGVQTNDPWGSPYQYSGSNQTYSIWSLGPNVNDAADDVQPER